MLATIISSSYRMRILQKMQTIAKVINAKIKISDLFWPVEASGESCICIGPQRWVGIINGQTCFRGMRAALNGT